MDSMGITDQCGRARRCKLQAEVKWLGLLREKEKHLVLDTSGRASHDGLKEFNRAELYALQANCSALQFGEV